jgi:hypothetical protein
MRNWHGRKKATPVFIQLICQFKVGKKITRALFGHKKAR